MGYPYKIFVFRVSVQTKTLRSCYTLGSQKYYNHGPARAYATHQMFKGPLSKFISKSKLLSRTNRFKCQVLRPSSYKLFFKPFYRLSETNLQNDRRQSDICYWIHLNEFTFFVIILFLWICFFCYFLIRRISCIRVR